MRWVAPTEKDTANETLEKLIAEITATNSKILDGQSRLGELQTAIRALR